MRDLYSVKTLNNAGISKNLLRVDDLALKTNPNIKILCFTLMESFGLDFLISLVEDTIEVIKQDASNDWFICFLPFYNEGHHDKKMYESVIPNIKFNGIPYFIAPEYDNVESMFLLIKGGDIFVNMRYHATLLALQRGIPAVTICQDNHPHYFNKLHYIHDYFSDPNIIDVSQYKKESLSPILWKLLRDLK